jgi:hypothetical protein
MISISYYQSDDSYSHRYTIYTVPCKMVQGYYDDQNDSVNDFWIIVEESVLPKCYDQIVKNIKDYSETNQFRKLYARSNPKKVYESLIRLIKKFKRNNCYMNENGSYVDKYGFDYTDYYLTDISGICLRAVKVIDDFPDDSKNQNLSLIPRTLPRGFPGILRKEALDAVRQLLDNLKNNAQGWDQLEKRRKVLQHELFLFSKGHQGVEGPHPRSKSKSGSKAKTKSKTMKKSKARTKSKTMKKN